MRVKFSLLIIVLFTIISCSKLGKVKTVMEGMALEIDSKSYKIGDVIEIPAELKSNTKSVALVIGDEVIKDFKISTKFFNLGDNLMSLDVEMENGEHLSQDINIKVFAKNKEVNLTFDIVKEYPHDGTFFTQGFELEGNTIYESTGQLGESKILKYNLGSLTANTQKALSNDVFGEGSCLVFDKIYQLSWQNKKGFIYNKSNLELISEFSYPEELKEGWGITFDGEYLIVSDGSSQLYYLDYHTPEKLVKIINVAGSDQTYEQLNELEFHNGYIYANVWQQSIIIKINPKTGEVVGKMDLSEIYQKNTKGDDDVLNGITFKEENMLVTGKNWTKIYELKWK